MNRTLTSEALFVFVHQLEIEYKMGGTLVQLTIASFGVCFCVGPLLWAPLSEQVSICIDAFMGRLLMVLPSSVAGRSSSSVSWRSQ